MNPYAQSVLSESESFYLPRPRLDVTYGAYWSRTAKRCFVCGGNPCTCDPHATRCGCKTCSDMSGFWASYMEGVL